MSPRRPTVAHSLFTFDISPLRDVAQMSDYGIRIIYFHYKPFSRCRLDVRLWHALSFIFRNEPFMWCRPDTRLRHGQFTFTFRGVASDTRSVFSHFVGISGGLPPDFLFMLHAVNFFLCALLICSCASCLHLLYLMSELSCEYIQSTHLAC